MYILKENGVISEIACGNNFEYVLSDGNYFANTDYKVLQSQTNGIFIPCMKMIRNGKVDLYYVTDDYCPISSMFSGITTDKLISIVTNLFGSVIDVRNNGFLVCQCIDLSWDKIFVEQNTLKVKLVYLPLHIRAFDSYPEFENELRASLVKWIDKVIDEKNERLKRFMADLCDGSLSIEDICSRSRKMGTSFVPAQKEVKTSGIRNEESSVIKLIAMNAPVHFEMMIDSDNVLIGKKQESVDKVVSFNKMISRKHCRIQRVKGEYFISDEGSANGTFVNGIRVLAGQRCQIKKGDIIRLADSDFQIV